MPYKYIGRKTVFKGKTLWEIVGNLKDYGVGRIVTRSMFERYPEPSYYKILKVETLPNPKNPSIDDVRKVRVLIEKTFRGITNPEPSEVESTSYKTDYILIPKDEEATFCKENVTKEEKILPRTLQFPPLLKACLIQEMKNKNEPIDKLELPAVYKRAMQSRYRIAEEGEQPTIEIDSGLGKPVSPRLYDGIKL